MQLLKKKILENDFDWEIQMIIKDFIDRVITQDINRPPRPVAFILTQFPDTEANQFRFQIIKPILDLIV